MPKSIIRIFFFISIYWISYFASAQGKKIYTIEVGLDIPKLLISLDPSQQKYEGEVGVVFNQKIAFVFQPGYRYQKSHKTNYDYKAEGIYFRTGAFYQFQESLPRFQSGIGFLFSKSIFSDWTTTSLANPFWGIFRGNTNPRIHQISWIEIPFMFKWYIKNYFYFKLIYSNRFLIKNPRYNESFPVYTVVGYGSTQFIFMPALTTTVGFILPLKK